jgi:Protein of unknown function (DUF2442)
VHVIRIVAVKPLEGFVLELSFSNGETRTVNVDSFLHGPVFERLRTDPAMFRAVRVDATLGTILWPTGADLCPDVLYAVAASR